MKLRKWILVSVLVGMLAGCERASSGDRVLVSKEAYDSGLMEPKRYDVVVFKYPGGPVKQGTPTNYIKRLLGLPGELLAILFGRVYRWTPQPGDAPPFEDLKEDRSNEKELGQSEFMHVNAKNAWFEDGDDHNDGKVRGFEILRKPPHVMLAMRRIVYDNDYQAADLKGKLDRWTPKADSDWKHDAGTGFTCESKPGKVDWLRYQHLLRPDDGPVGAAGGQTGAASSTICSITTVSRAYPSATLSPMCRTGSAISCSSATSRSRKRRGNSGSSSTAASSAIRPVSTSPTGIARCSASPRMALRKSSRPSPRG